MTRAIPPGSTIGVLGSGQLGRMFAIAARRMGYRVHTFSPDQDTPTGHLADVEITRPYDDLDAVRSFARQVDVVTFEFENVPAATAGAVSAIVPVRPEGHILHTTQNRLREKNFLRDHGLPVTPFVPIRSEEEAIEQAPSLGGNAILKTSAWGYDGKGQRPIDSPEQVREAWRSLGASEAVLEQRVDFELELSVVIARGVAGEMVAFEPTKNQHVRGILDLSTVPIDLAPPQRHRAIEIAHAVAQALDLVGILCIEMFLTRSGDLLINELAPRPHNSGHWTFDAATTSQFEQQLRAVCGLPLGSPELLRPAAMANLLGDLWQTGEPNWSAALGLPDVKLHLYGKAEPRPGRKMGHLTALAAEAGLAAEQVLEARRRLTNFDAFNAGPESRE